MGDGENVLFSGDNNEAIYQRLNFTSSSSSTESYGPNPPDVDPNEKEPIKNRKGRKNKWEADHHRHKSDKNYVKYESNSDNPQKFYCDKKSSLGSLENTYCLYLTSYETEDLPKTEVTLQKFENAIKDIITNKYKLIQAKCGLLAIFSRDEDADRVLKMNIAQIFGGPVQVANLSRNENVYKKGIVFKDIPWCISNKELMNALDKQGIRYGKIKRFKNLVRIEILNSSHLERLLQEGLNFYDCIAFVGVLENSSVEAYHNDIIQCYKCQGFWHTAAHCKNSIRCVRCGDNHEVEYCPRTKNNPICCNCHGAHHAAYKLCPIRMRLLNSVNVAISYSSRQKSGN